MSTLNVVNVYRSQRCDNGCNVISVIWNRIFLVSWVVQIVADHVKSVPNGKRINLQYNVPIFVKLLKCGYKWLWSGYNMYFLTDICCFCLKTDSILHALHDTMSDNLTYYEKLSKFLGDTVGLLNKNRLEGTSIIIFVLDCRIWLR